MFRLGVPCSGWGFNCIQIVFLFCLYLFVYPVFVVSVSRAQSMLFFHPTSTFSLLVATCCPVFYYPSPAIPPVSSNLLQLI